MNIDWQVESGLRTAVFLSATSSDLGECRRRVSEILLQAGIFPVVQDYFGPDTRTIENLILDKVLAADAVICIVGFAFGSAPATNGKSGSRSYTQMEYDLAIRYEKQVYLFVASDDFGQAYPVTEAEDFRANQLAHREAITKGSKKYDVFSSVAKLESLIHALVHQVLAKPARRLMHYVHPPPEPICFVGRTDESDQLNAAIDKRLPSLVVIVGMGGQGKTTLLAHTIKERNTLPFASGIWVSAERGGFSFSEFLDSALALFMEKRFNKTELPRMDERIRELMALLQARPLLIVIDAIERWLCGWGGSKQIDGLHDLSLRQGACEGLDKFLQQASALENGSHLVITSRALPAALDSVAHAIIPVFPRGNSETGLPALSLDASIELLERLGVTGPPEKLRDLARSLVCHPLALTGFARVASRVGCNWNDLLSGVGPDPAKVFHSLLDGVREHLPNRNHSEKLLRYASLLPEGAPLDLLGCLLRSDEENPPTPAARSDLLAQVLTLADWNLVGWDSAARSIRLHALVAEYFAELISETEKSIIHRRAAAWYEPQGIGSDSTSLTKAVLALRHSVFAKDAELSLKLMFQGSHDSTFNRLVLYGHLWECGELLASMQPVATGLAKVRCILARTQVLNELELANRALTDVLEATTIVLAQAEPRWPPLQSLLAQCYGFQGLIHIETAKATDALPLFDKAVSIYDSLAVNTGDYTMDFAKTLANRGVAKWGSGDWDGAGEDYQRVLVLLSNPEREISQEKSLMAHEIRCRLGAIDLARGNYAIAVQNLESATGDLQEMLAKSQVPPNKNNFSAFISLMAAYIAGNNPEQALKVMQDLLPPLEELARHGRWEFNSLLAQARTNEATAFLLQGRLENAAQSSARAVGLYDDLVEKGAAQFRGQLGNALFRQAETHIRLGAEAKGKDDLQRALELSRDWLDNWTGECNIQTVFIHNALGTLFYLPGGFSDEKRTILTMLSRCVERIVSATPRNAALLRDAQMLKDKWPSLLVEAQQFGMEWHQIFPTISDKEPR